MIGSQPDFITIGREAALGAKQQPSIVHQHVEARVAGIKFGGGAAHLPQVGQVGQQHVDPVMAGGSFDFALGGGGLPGIAGQQNNVSTFFSQLGGRFFANARGGPGDEDELIL